MSMTTEQFIASVKEIGMQRESEQMYRRKKEYFDTNREDIVIILGMLYKKDNHSAEVMHRFIKEIQPLLQKSTATINERIRTLVNWGCISSEEPTAARRTVKIVFKKLPCFMEDTP